MQSRRHASHEGEEHSIDLAPMLDFVLNLLIFFIITTSFVRESGTSVVHPFAETAEAQASGNILVAVRADGEVWMDRRQVDLREIRPTIERLHIERPEDTVIVVADKAAKAGLVAEVMDEIQLGGIREVALGATAPSAD
ncbi:MAG: ExbD/TolR family protein [Candidatus Binatia bacterium]